MHSRRRARVSNGLLLTLAAVLLAAAGVFYFRLSGQDAAPADQFVGLYCPKCDRFFRLSHRDFEKLWNKREFQRVAGEKELLFKCKKCGQITAFRADQPPAATQPGGG